jgi:hypothetical protein
MTPVRFRACACPGTPHPKGDTVTFHPQLPFEANVAAVSAIFSGDGDSNANKAWAVYLHNGPAAWNLVDAEGEPVPLTREAIDALPFADQWEIADKADDIYQGTVLSPLVRRMSEFSETSPTTESSPRRTKR